MDEGEEEEEEGGAPGRGVLRLGWGGRGEKERGRESRDTGGERGRERDALLQRSGRDDVLPGFQFGGKAADATAW